MGEARKYTELLEIMLATRPMKKKINAMKE